VLIGLLLATLMVNGVGLYGTSRALSEALEPVELPGREEVVEFDLVDPSSDELRFVDQHRANDRAPDETKRLAEVDSDVERETQAPLGPDSQPSKPSRPQPEQQEEAQGQPDGGERGEAQGEGELEGEGEGEDPGSGDDRLATADDGSTASEGSAAAARQGSSDVLAKLGGSPSVLSETFGRPGADDRLRDVDEGVENVLQSKRHIYASFFNRIRDRVADQWRPQRAHDAVDPQRTKYGDKQRTTVLMVRLDEKGEILKVVIERKSGAPHLDAEAVRAMKAAAPFPNPPSGLANSSGHIDFRFGFILDFQGGSRIFRYQN
jgi:TonB family protein